jgi:hypothetical protein
MISKNGESSHSSPKALQCVSAWFGVFGRLRIMAPSMGEKRDGDKIARQYDQIGMELIHNLDSFANWYDREMVFVVKIA